MSAVNDWPTSTEPKYLVEELKNEIKCKLTFDNLKDFLKDLKPDKDAWKMEALSSLLEMFDFERKKVFDRTIELDTVIDRLSRHYKSNYH
jgi:predicted house-cleaning noncanonical NTP pyrophosphatase (MazG superfamily)